MGQPSKLLKKGFGDASVGCIEPAEVAARRDAHSLSQRVVFSTVGPPTKASRPGDRKESQDFVGFPASVDSQSDSVVEQELARNETDYIAPRCSIPEHAK